MVAHLPCKIVYKLKIQYKHIKDHNSPNLWNLVACKLTNPNNKPMESFFYHILAREIYDHVTS